MSHDPDLCHGLASDLSPDGRLLAVGAGAPDADRPGPLVIWDVVAGTIARRRTVADGGVGLDGGRLVQWSPSGALLVAATHTNQLTTYDARSPELAELGRVALSFDDGAPGCVLLPGEAELFTHGEEGVAIVPVRGRHDPSSPDVRWLGLPEFPFWAIAAFDDLVVGVEPDTVTAYDRTRRAIRYTAPACPGDSDAGCAFSPDGRTLAIASNRRIRLLDSATGKELAAHPGMAARVGSIVWAAGGTRLAVSYDTLPGRAERGAVVVLERAGALARLPVRPHAHAWLTAPDLRMFAFAPDGARGAVSTADGELVVFELAAGARELYRVALGDPAEWLGLYWGAGDTLVVASSLELQFLDATSGARRSRAPLGFRVRRDV